MDAITALTALGMLTLILIGVEVITVYATKGFAYGFSANRAPAEYAGLRKRVENIYRNQIESVTYMAPVLAATALLGLDTQPDAGIVPMLIAIMVWARVGFAAAYFTGLPFVRVPFFGAGTMTTLILGFIILSHAGTAM